MKFTNSTNSIYDDVDDDDDDGTKSKEILACWWCVGAMEQVSLLGA
jgi:hypothetical protein